MMAEESATSHVQYPRIGHAFRIYRLVTYKNYDDNVGS